MISKIKKPVSILLSLIMVFSVFAIVPLSASAGYWYSDLARGTLIQPGDTLSFEEIGSFKFADYNDPTIIHEVKGSDFSYNEATLSVTDGYYSFGSTKLLPTSVSPGGLLIADYDSTTKMATFGVQNITHSFDETTGTLTIGGSGVVPRNYAFTGSDVYGVVFAQSNLVKHLIIDATDMIAVKEDAFMAYTGGCVLEDVEINSTSSTPLIIEKQAVFYESGNTVTITVNAVKLATVTDSPVNNYGSPVNLIYNVEQPITFKKNALTELWGDLTVTFPAGCKIFIPGGPQFTDSRLQEEYDMLAEDGMEEFFWDMHPDLVEGTDYVLGDARYEELTPLNASLVVGNYNTALFSAPTYTITDESVNGTVTASVNGTNVTEAEENADVTLTVAPAEGYQFVSISAGDVSLTTVTEGSQYSFTMPNKPVTVTAVFEEIPAAENAFVKVTSELEDWSGEYLVVYEADNAPDKVFNSAANLSSGANTLQAAFGVSDGNIDYDDTTAAAAVTIAKIEDTGCYSIKTASGTYIGRSNDTNGIDERDSALDNTIAWDNGSVKITSAGGAIMRYNTGASQFRYYKTATYTNQQPIQLYKLTAAEPAPETFKVYVKKLTGETNTIENLTGETTVAQLKEIIADQIDIPATAQRLIFAGKQLDDAKTLAEYNIGEESTIHLVIRGYTVTWLNYDDSELGTTTVQYGATPSYDGATPQKPDDATNYYTFSGWDPEVSAVTGDETYTATFTAAEKPEVIKDCNNKYGDFRLYSNVPIVQFSNSDALLTGAIIPITYGDGNTMVPLVDAKGYSYKLYDQTGTEIPFEITSSNSEPGSGYGFSDDVTVYTNVLEWTLPANSNALYIVATEPDPITYTVTWMNGDDILETDTDLEPGALPSYDGATPTKDEDDDFTYDFIGWTCGPNFYTPEELPIVDGDTTYVATFESTPKHETGYYVVSTMTNWKIDDNYLLTKNTEAEGDEFMLNGAALTSNDAIKVVKYEPGNWTWYPSGTGNDYAITADGTYDIYFRPNADGGDDWFEGCIYVVVPPHVHDFIYCDYGDTIEAICTASGCDLTDDNEVTLTIVAPTLTIVGQTGDGISEYATLTGLEAFNEATGLNVAETDIKYYGVETVEIDGNTYKRQGDELDGAPTDAGEYIAGLTLSDVKISETATRDVTARTWYTITEPAPTYTVIWMNGDEVLETDENVEPGALPSYDGETPTKDEDDDFTYDFIGWTCGPNFYEPEELPIVDGDTTYVATFESTPKHEAGYYVVGTMTEWKIDDAYLLTANTEAEGDEFMLNGVALTSNDAIKIVKYEPGNWTWFPDGEGNDYAITANGTYDIYFRPNCDGGDEWFENCIKAVNVTEYTITWKNDDGSVIDTTTVVYGDTPTHADATKAPDKYYTYTFAGWTPEITAVTGDAEYTAQFTPVAKTFMVFVKRPTGSTINVYDLTGETTVAQLKAIIAEKENIPVTEQKLIFAGTQLEDEKTLAKYNIEKESTLHLVLNTYTVTWMVGEEIVETDENVEYGTTPVYDGAEPEKAEDDDYTYAFAGWTDGENTYAADAELPAVTGDVTYTAVFDGTAKHEAGYYVVGTMTEWKIDDNYLLTKNTEAEGDEFMLNGVALTSNDAIKVVKYEPGNWTWFPDGEGNDYEITANGTYDIYFRPNSDGGDDWYEHVILAVNVTEYTITWKNDDGTVIDTTTVAYGDTPTHADATKDATAQYTYNFTGWTPEVVAATADAEYTATFDSVVNEYTITWKNDDGSVIDTTTVAYGEVPTHADVTKDATAQYTYTFTGWDTEPVAVTGDAEYTATFSSAVNEYTITWKNDDGSVIDTTTVAYGEVPTHADATKDATAQYTYTFTGWDTEPVAVTGDAEYTATFSSTVNEYTITWKNDDGTVIDTTTVAYGDTPTHADATKDATEQYTYTFKAWSPEVVAVTGDAEYTATFEAVKKTLLGDADGDGEVSVIDVTYMQRVLARIPIAKELNLAAADVDGDGELTVADTTYIQRFLTGMPTDYPINEYVEK